MRFKTATIAVFLLSFVSASAQPEERNGVVIGGVTWLGKPPPSLAVRIRGNGLNLIDWTDANGEYIFSVPSGRYAVTAPGNWASEQYRTERVKVKSGEVEIIDFDF